MEWCLRFVSEFSAHPLGHHTRFLTMTRVPPGDPGAQEHEMILRCIEHAVVVDQLQVCEIAALEVLIRRAQLIELRHREKVTGGTMGVSVDDDAHIYLGTGRKNAAVKERRKLAELRGHPAPKK